MRAPVTSHDQRRSVVLHPLDLPGVREALSAIGGVDLICPPDEDGVARALRCASVLVTRRWRQDYLQPALRIVQAMSSSYDQFPLEELRDSGVILCSASGLHEVVAEHAIALLLSVTRQIWRSVADATAWRSEARVVTELAGTTIVILGLGAIGRGIARRLEDWDVRIIGVTRTPASHASSLFDVRPLSGLAEACSEAAALVVAIPLSSGTRRIVSARVLDALGLGYVVNVARGAIVDEAALAERLADGRLLGVGLDVFEREPLTENSPFWSLQNVAVTPHMAGLSPRYADRLAYRLERNLLALEGLASWQSRVC